MNFAIVIIGAGALLLIATTMYRNGRDDDDTPFVEDEEAYQASLEEPPDYWTFGPAPRVPTVPSVPSVPTIPLYEGVDPDYFGE